MNLHAEPQNVLNFFYALNQIPRASRNEAGVIAYLQKFAKERNLPCFVDAANNVIIKKPATPGFENRPTVILQGHMDMVPEKGPHSTHNFETDPIEMSLDGEWLHANDTTLGADNGIAVAMALAVLDSKDISHPALECLFTACEEVGMDGAIGLDASLLDGKYLLNIDTEEEDEFIVSCAGGCRLDVYVPIYQDDTDKVYNAALALRVHNLHGGHSGLEIHKQRANSNQVMARVLYELARKFNYQVASFRGGTKHNAIPSDTKATIAVRSEDVSAIRAYLADKQEVYRKEFTPQDENITLSVEEVPVPSIVYAPTTTESLLSFLYLAPHGVIGMSQTLPGLVETSLNLAIVEEEERVIHLLISLRSSAINPMHYLTERLRLLGDLLGAKVSVQGAYPAWEYESGSSLEVQATEVYTRVFNRAPIVTAVHAGLECGLLKEHLPNTQMISFGPDIEGAHTPKERCNMASVKRIYDFLLELLKELK